MNGNAEIPRVAEPSSRQELCEQVQAAFRAERPLHVAGLGTKQALGAWPRADEGGNALRLTTTGLHRVVAYEPRDLVITVEAGIRWSSLQELLATHGQWLPFDPPYPGGTLGGTLATGVTGPRRQRYGTAKDHLLGLHVVSPRGDLTRSGGRVVKNVTGFDLHRPHVGAFGSLGILVEATFKVSVRPLLSQALLVPFASVAAGHHWLLDVAQSPLQPTALELLGGALAGECAQRFGLAWPRAAALALVGVEGSPPFVRRHLAELQARLPAGAEGLVVEDARREWEALAQLPATGGGVTVRLGTKPSALAACIPAALASHASVSVGLGLARLHWPRDAGVEAIGAWVARLDTMAAVHGGYACVASAPTDLDGRHALPFYPPRLATTPAHRLFSSLKHAWDPKHLLNPARAPI